MVHHHLLQKCPPGLVYNPATELCDYVYNVPSCNEPQTSSTTSTSLPITTTENNCITFPDSIECQTTLIFSTTDEPSPTPPPTEPTTEPTIESTTEEPTTEPQMITATTEELYTIDPQTIIPKGIKRNVFMDFRIKSP